MSTSTATLREPSVEDMDAYVEKDAYVTVDSRAVILDLSDDVNAPLPRGGSGQSRAAQVAVQRWQEQSRRPALPLASAARTDKPAGERLAPAPAMDPTSRWRWLSATVRDACAKRLRE